MLVFIADFLAQMKDLMKEQDLSSLASGSKARFECVHACVRACACVCACVCAPYYFKIYHYKCRLQPYLQTKYKNPFPSFLIFKWLTNIL